MEKAALVISLVALVFSFIAIWRTKVLYDHYDDLLTFFLNQFDIITSHIDESKDDTPAQEDSGEAL